jgi:site-specific DNA recombinase
MQSQKRVTIINQAPAQASIQADGALRKKRVCAYARVSTDQEDQINSYKAQIHEYTRMINENPNWIFQGMYADEGLSGTSIKNRIQFQNMVNDAKNGKIDLVLTKSISRFARNTVDSLTIIRELRNINVEVFFEKENIYSSDSKVDFMLTIFSSIAQEESRNISENVKWGFRKRYKEGIVHINTKRFLGYDKDESGKIVINLEQAEIIKMIYNLYVAGLSTREIAEHLTNNSIKNGRGEIFWKPATITTILTNEKYCGDAILQKRVTIDYLTHKSVINTGQAPKYHITNNHDPIISKEVFMIVQNLKKERSKETNETRFANRFPLSGIVYCGVCHRKMNRQHYNPNTTYNRIVLSCKGKSNSKCACDNAPFDNDLLEALSAHVFHEIHQESPSIINDVMELLESNLSIPKIKTDIDSKVAEIIKIENEIKALIQLRISSASKDDDKYYQMMFDEKKSVLKELNSRLGHLETGMMDTHMNRERLVQIEHFLENKNAILSRETLTSLIKRIVVNSSKEVTFMMCKSEITEDNFTSNLDFLSDLLPLLTGTYKNIHWKLIEVEV